MISVVFIVVVMCVVFLLLLVWELGWLVLLNISGMLSVWKVLSLLLFSGEF